MKRFLLFARFLVYASGVLLLVTVCAVSTAQAFTHNTDQEIMAADDNGNAGNLRMDKEVPNDKQVVSAVDSCAGPTALLSVLDRPTISDSVCSAKKNKVIAELGYVYQIETGNDFNTLQTLPQPEIRYGTGNNVELKLFPPDYILQTTHTAGNTSRIDGAGDAGVGVKYEFGYGEKWGFAADTAVTFASGRKDFSANATGAIVNGIFAYNVNEDIGVGLQIGLFHLFSPVGSTQETSVNPILVVTDQLNEITDRLQLYAECYNAIDLMHGTGITSFIDAGVQYLLSQNIEIDLEAGHNLTNLPYNNTTYVGFGTGLEF